MDEKFKLSIKDDAAEIILRRDGSVFWLSGESIGGSGWSQTFSVGELSQLAQLLDDALNGFS